MALIVEDGTGLPDAEAYISAADASAYFAARGVVAWAALSVADQESALRAGCDFMESRYTWQGERTTASLRLAYGYAVPSSTVPQGLSWPRRGVRADGVNLPADQVPVQIARANAELALRASAGELAPDEGSQVTRETIGPITTEYAAGARQNPRYAAVEALVSRFTLAAGGIAVVRA
ncbi:DnaT-like ssDNA-binding protein [Dyella caseinilytica]|uniref:Putative DnaT-like domain-containing protein n=1 Tax=Dyella caseinilytica TaxID=1849581 RepID=A0ABX7GQ61_9GAMM|nr:DnaT-like ssDNA-binding protein [Dyella caseinilytica]QRN52395.1 hypothetical protein ISN74_13005 [Dyella caseinilytica]GGA05625.1 hypothetical protein GCM10011408_28180 [Dyella caseinilytica]